MALVVRSGGVPVALRSRIARSVTALDSVEMFLTGEQYLSGRIAHREDAVIALHALVIIRYSFHLAKNHFYFLAQWREK